MDSLPFGTERKVSLLLPNRRQGNTPYDGEIHDSTRMTQSETRVEMEHILNFITKTTCCLLIAFVGIALSMPCHAGSTEETESEMHEAKTAKVPGKTLDGLDHLLAVADPITNIAFDPALVENVIGFALSPKPESELYHMGDKYNASTAYHEFDMSTSVRRILRIAFNPRFPASVITPSSVRVAYFPKTGGQENNFPELWKRVNGGLDTPIVARAVEYNENTPDRHTGTYHAYELDRTLILWKHRSGIVLISLSRQRGKSGTGKKGKVLGPENEWNFFYTGVKGVNKTGLGWIKSYMYDSFSVIVYHQKKLGDNALRCAVFKGLRAGWAGMNMVGKRHIFDGLRRWEKDMRMVFESESLPPFEEMAELLSAIDRLSDDELKAAYGIYLAKLEERFGDVKVAGDTLSEFVREKTYISGIGREEMRMALVLEYVKTHLGRKPLIDIMAVLNAGRR